MIDLGIVRPGSTIRIPFSTFDKDDGSSVTMTNFADADILAYKDGSTTQRASAAGITATTDFDTSDAGAGKHLATIDLADNTTSAFWNAGSEYLIAIGAVTVDGVTTGGWIARFKIGYRGAAIDTTIATLSTQTSFTLTVGPAEDDALNGCVVCIHDIASALQCGFALVLDYTGSTKTVTLAAGTTFTAAAGDNISVFPRSDLSYILGVVVSPTTAQLGVNAVQAGATAWNSGAIKTTSFTAGAIDAAAIAADAIGASELADGAITAATFAAGAIDATAIANGAIDAATFAAGAIDAAAIATGAIDADAIADNAIDAGAIAADAITAAKIADGAIDAATFAAGAINAAAIAADAITDAKVASDVTIASVTGAVGSVTGNVGGNVTGSVGSVATGGIAAASFAAGAINAAAIAADAITDAKVASDVTIASVTGAVGSVTGNVGGNVTGSVGSLATQAKADVNAEVVDALATDTYAEPGQGAPAATTSLAAKINYLFKAWRNKKTQTSSTLSLFADDASTVDQKATCSDDATTTTVGEIASGP